MWHFEDRAKQKKVTQRKNITFRLIFQSGMCGGANEHIFEKLDIQTSPRNRCKKIYKWNKSFKNQKVVKSCWKISWFYLNPLNRVNNFCDDKKVFKNVTMWMSVRGAGGGRAALDCQKWYICLWSFLIKIIFFGVFWGKNYVWDIFRQHFIF